MADAAAHELIIVRRHEEDEHEHHSSAWKVAHADFMTAMMAFFLIMWLINVTDDEIRKGIAEYFNPIHLSQGSTELKGLHEPNIDPEKSVVKRSANSDISPAFNPLELTPGPADQNVIGEEQVAEVNGQEPVAEGALDPAVLGNDAGTPALPGGAASAQGERAAFQDPYAVLAELAERYTAEHAASSAVRDADDRLVGVAGGEVDRDPFDPVYWQLSQMPPARTERPGDPLSAATVPNGAVPDAAAPVALDRGIEAGDEAAARGDAAPQAGAAVAPGIAGPVLRQTTIAEIVAPEAQPSADIPEAPRPSDAPDVATPATASDIAVPPAADHGPTVATAQAVAMAIARTVGDTLAGEVLPELSVTATGEGVLINLTDDAEFSMFAVGSAIPDAKVVVLLEGIAAVLAMQPGEVVIRGYTDGRPFRSDTYDNWRLSAARAHMAYYMLTRGGLDASRVAAIEGHADRSLKNQNDPYAAENRRIEILLKGAGP